MGWKRIPLPFLLLMGVLPSFLSAQDCPPDLVKANRETSVFVHTRKTIKTTGEVKEVTGTGFIVSPSGYVLTNNHVVQKGENVDEVTITGAIGSRNAARASLSIIAQNETNDVALLKFDNTNLTYKSVSIGDPSAVEVGTALCSIGFPLEVEFFAVSGRLGGKGGPNGRWLTQMPSNPGESGAPVFVSTGKVVAMKVAGYTNAQNVNLLIPLNLAQQLLILVPDRNSNPYDTLRTALNSAWKDPWVRVSTPSRNDWDVFSVVQLDNCVFWWRDESHSVSNIVRSEASVDRKVLLNLMRAENVSMEGELANRKWDVDLKDPTGRAMGMGGSSSIIWLNTQPGGSPPINNSSPVQYGQSELGLLLDTEEQASKVAAVIQQLIQSCQGH